MPHDLEGRCHCGNLSARLTATRPAPELPSRACGCTYCAPRRMRWTSDPSGHVELRVRDAGDLSRYTFGTATADFLVCKRCGYLVAALSHDAPHHAVINIDILEATDDFPESVSTDFDAEDRTARLARRRGTWTPARLVVG